MKKKNIPWFYASDHSLNIQVLFLLIIISVSHLTSFASLTPINGDKSLLVKRLRQEITHDDSYKEKRQKCSGAPDSHQSVVIKNDWTQLHWAAYYGYGTLTKALIKTCADKDAQDNHGETPLHKAVHNGHKEAVEILLRAGVNKDAQDTHGSTPLHKAVRKGQNVIVDVLIKAGATKDALDTWNATPLYYAVLENHEKIVEILLRAGVKTNSVDKIYGRIPFHVAAYNGNGVIVELFLKYDAALDVVDEYGKTPLCSAVEAGHKKVVEILLKAGAKADTIDMYNRTPLAQALQIQAQGKDRHSIINILLFMEMDTLFLKKKVTFSLKTHNLLKRWECETSAFESIFERSKELMEEYYTELSTLFQDYGIAKVLATLIIEYHNSVDTRISLFKKAEVLSATE